MRFRALVDLYEGKTKAMSTRSRLRAALAAFESLPRAPREEHAPMLALIHALTNGFDLPLVTCWCVVKHYSDGFARPIIWLGCTTRDQAETMAPMLAEYFNSRHPHSKPDRYEVERRTCEISEVIDPSFTAEEYNQLLERYR